MMGWMFLRKRFFFLLFLWFIHQHQVFSFENIAFYYGNPPAPNALLFYQKIIVDPQSGVDPKHYSAPDRDIFAYVSLGEIDPHTEYSKEIPQSWIIGKNKAWDSLIPDQSNPDWRDFMIKRVIEPLWKKGYRGFFLDTLDSYQLTSSKPILLEKQRQGLMTLIREIKILYPDAKLIFNRGFEILPEVHSLANEVVAESLFSGWDNAKKRYYTISETTRNALIQELNQVKKFNIPITVIDYLPQAQAKDAKALAKKIEALGFSAWVTNGLLTKFYLFDKNLVSRKILLFYQGKPGNPDQMAQSVSSRMFSLPLNYLGYVTELRSLDEPLPNITKKDYAGVVVNISGGMEDKAEALYRWYQYLKKIGIPFVIFNDFGLGGSAEKLKTFDLIKKSYTRKIRENTNITYRDPMIGYEAMPFISNDVMQAIKLKRGQKLLTIKASNIDFDIAGITPWGGYFLTSSYLLPTINSNYLWTINPFLFFKVALKLPTLPVPDTTSENGMRLMMVHIDGDGFVNRGEWYNGPFCGQIMLDELLETYPVPTTVSIIEGEIGKAGLYPKDSNQLEAIAKKIFEKPYIEIASHTYSHPFNWYDATHYKKNNPNPYTLQIPGYRLDLAREVKGSVAYIDKNLTTPEKPCKVFLWSGEGDPSETALKYTYDLGLSNLNPGSIMTNYNKTITRASSHGLYKGPWFQVFAAIGNDREAETTERLFYSLISILNALKLTDATLRLEPIDIYFHFYTVGQPGGIKALKKVYDWALSQPVLHRFVSEYFNIIMDFNELALVQEGDGFLFVTKGFLREIRVPQSMGFPDLMNSRNVIGYRLIHSDYYIHLGSLSKSFLTFSKNPPKAPYLIFSNAEVTRFYREGNKIYFSLKSMLPQKFSFNNVQNCTLFEGNQKIKPYNETPTEKNYVFKTGGMRDFTFQCE